MTKNEGSQSFAGFLKVFLDAASDLRHTNQTTHAAKTKPEDSQEIYQSCE